MIEANIFRVRVFVICQVVNYCPMCVHHFIYSSEQQSFYV